jgi:hypothetical protein
MHNTKLGWEWLLQQQSHGKTVTARTRKHRLSVVANMHQNTTNLTKAVGIQFGACQQASSGLDPLKHGVQFLKAPTDICQIVAPIAAASLFDFTQHISLGPSGLPRKAILPMSNAIPNFS